MYNWLKAEISTVRTRRFFVVEPLDLSPALLLEARVNLKLPRDYVEFLFEVGQARLFRQQDGYLVGVYPIASEKQLSDGDVALNFGHRGATRVFFIKSLLREGLTSPVFKEAGKKMVKVAESFEIWLRESITFARKQFSKSEWKEIENGPRPFSKSEIEIVAARRLFGWKVIGTDSQGDTIFEVKNCSRRILPFLSLGVRHKLGKFEGGIWLKVDQIAPTETGRVSMDCYKDMAGCDEIEVFDLPDPEPEDRTRYWEFSVVDESAAGARSPQDA